MYLATWEHCDLGKNDFGGTMRMEVIWEWIQKRTERDETEIETTDETMEEWAF